MPDENNINSFDWIKMIKMVRQVNNIILKLEYSGGRFIDCIGKYCLQYIKKYVKKCHTHMDYFKNMWIDISLYKLYIKETQNDHERIYIINKSILCFILYDFIKNNIYFYEFK
jgi:hypothetical protein